MKLIDNWRKAHKMISVQAFALIGLWLLLPEKQQVEILTLLWWDIKPERVPQVLAFVGLVGRLVQQSAVSAPAQSQRGES